MIDADSKPTDGPKKPITISQRAYPGFHTGGLVSSPELRVGEVPVILSGETVLPKHDTTASNVVVDRGYHWQPMKDCPINSKVQLLGKGGLPQYGYWDGKNPFWVGWAPIPTRDPNGQQGV